MERKPAAVFPLAQFLAEEMEARGWTAVDVAIRMRNKNDMVRNAAILDVLLAVHDDGLLVDDDTFEGLASAFDVSVEYFRNLDASWRKWPDRRCIFECPEHLFSGVWNFEDSPSPPQDPDRG